MDRIEMAAEGANLAVLAAGLVVPADRPGRYSVLRAATRVPIIVVAKSQDGRTFSC